MLILIFSASIVCSACNHVEDTSKSQIAVIIKKDETAAQSPTQIFFEEKEEESRSQKERGAGESQTILFLIGFVGNPALLNYSVIHYSFIRSPLFFGNAPGIPLYLAKRALQI